MNINTHLKQLVTTAIAAVAALIGSTTSAQSNYYGSAYRAAPAATVQRIAYPYGQPPVAAYRQAPQRVTYAQARQIAQAQAQQMAQAQARYAQPRQVAYAYPQQQARVAPRPMAYAMPAPQAAVRAPQAAVGGAYLSFNGTYASAPSNLPAPVRAAVAAGNAIQNKPYVRGGGHSRVEDNAYDCSGSASYLLIKAGLLNRPLSSKEFASYGEAGPGRFITIYVKAGEHVFMSVCGLRLDTTGGFEGQGPRWRASARSMAGFTMRHPFGL